MVQVGANLTNPQKRAHAPEKGIKIRQIARYENICCGCKWKSQNTAV